MTILQLESELRSQLLEVIQGQQGSAEVTDEVVQAAAAAEQSNPTRQSALGIPAEEQQLLVHLRHRLLLLEEKALAYHQFCQQQKLDAEQLLPILWLLWLPLMQQLIAKKESLGRPLIQGVLGMQGAGKSTLGEALRMLLEPQYRVANFSIDDLYKTYAERMTLREADPRLIWRGPPGTHDVALGIELLKRCRSAQFGDNQSEDKLGEKSAQQSEITIEVPVFDKSCFEGQGDRAIPRQIQSPDIVLFDGWFVGVRPIDLQANPQAFETAPAPIVDDTTRQFARDCGDRLQEYLPLWEQLDGLIILALSDYRMSKTWRMEAEHKMRAQGKDGMSDAEIEQFVDYFWTALHPALYVEPLVKSGTADLVIEVGEGHQVQRIY